MLEKEEILSKRNFPKEERLQYYFECLKIKEAERPFSGMMLKLLDLTEEEERAYQRQKVSEISMKPTQKRDLLVKELLKPLFKEAGYKTSGGDWWKELSDGYILIHMKNSQFNDVVGGARFEFQFSAANKDSIHDKLKNEWIYHQMNCLTQADFIPDRGYFSPYGGSFMYQIDGYQEYLPKDVPMEDVIEHFREDFACYILPDLENITCMKDWEEYVEIAKKRRKELSYRIMNYYVSAIGACCSDNNMKNLIDLQHRLELTEEDISSHLDDWLVTMTNLSALPHHDPKPYILKSFLVQKEEKNRMQ